jgi:hypothetical protein
MKYSYIRPRNKSAFTPELKLLGTFFSISFLMLVLTYTFLLFKDYSFTKDLNRIENIDTQLHTSLSEMKEQIIYIEKEKVLAQSIKTQNAVLKDSITNLFDLVPSRITLSDAILAKNSLILKGITPNKDVYNFMLQAPLRSIFHQTYSSFYPAENGWMYFVSTNYTDEKNHED